MDRIGRYRIIKAVGRGATGVVYHAIDEKIERPVAIKTIQFAGQLGEEDQHRLRERLIREARLAGMLSHPGTTTIYDVGHEGAESVHVGVREGRWLREPEELVLHAEGGPHHQEQEHQDHRDVAHELLVHERVHREGKGRELEHHRELGPEEVPRV